MHIRLAMLSIVVACAPAPRPRYVSCIDRCYAQHREGPPGTREGCLDDCHYIGCATTLANQRDFNDGDWIALALGLVVLVVPAAVVIDKMLED